VFGSKFLACPPQSRSYLYLFPIEEAGPKSRHYGARFTGSRSQSAIFRYEILEVIYSVHASVFSSVNGNEDISYYKRLLSRLVEWLKW
jgi:hypothetical protein